MFTAAASCAIFAVFAFAGACCAVSEKPTTACVLVGIAAGALVLGHPFG